jgi:hypothetical protein
MQVNVIPQRSPQNFVREKDTNLLHHFACRSEIVDSYAICAEDLPVLLGVLNHHASADCGHFETAHRMAISVFMAHQT